MRNEWIANNINSIPPTSATVFSDIREAKSLPPMTASPVQNEWPINPPMMTEKIFLDDAKAIVAIWLRSPHSATKVSVSAWRNTFRFSELFVWLELSLLLSVSLVDEEPLASTSFSSLFLSINSSSTSLSSSDGPTIF